MAELTIKIEIDDPALKKDFFNTLRKQSEQDFVNFLGGTVEAVQASTDEDVEEFVTELLAKLIVNNYQNLKVQQATAEFQTSLLERHKDSITPRLAAKPFVLARKNSEPAAKGKQK